MPMIESERLWAIVLAGGEGARLGGLTRWLYGHERPKQYTALGGTRSLLRQTLDRVGRLVPPHQTVVVTMAHHARFLEPEVADLPGISVLYQPCDRGTAAGVLMPAHWIHARDPGATVVVFPTDHFIPDGAAFMVSVAEAVEHAQAHPPWLVLLGAPPTEPDTEYGWIEPGEPLDWPGRAAVRRVEGFVEKPSAIQARRLFAQGSLWNTFVFAADLEGLLETGREGVPLLHDRLLRFEVFVGTRHEPWAITQAYQLSPRADFCRSVLEATSRPFAVATIDPHTWCDLGTPERVARSLRTLGSPCAAWLDALAARA
jgi:mannose-1-phosphate guanylyltransferase